MGVPHHRFFFRKYRSSGHGIKIGAAGSEEYPNLAVKPKILTGANILRIDAGRNERNLDEQQVS
jgi:hypothetical protein